MSRTPPFFCGENEGVADAWQHLVEGMKFQICRVTHPRKPRKPSFQGLAGQRTNRLEYRSVQPRDTIQIGAKDTIDIAGNLPDSEVFSRPEFDAGLIFQGSDGFGRDGLVRKAGRMAISMSLTSRPPVARKEAASGFQSRIGAKTMTNVIPMARARATESTQSHTSSLDIPQQQAAIENALAMAAYYMRQPRTPETLHAAIGKTSRAMTLLKQSYAEVQIGGAA